MLENRRKKYKEMDASKKKQMLTRKAVKSRKRKISKLHVDVCIMESRVPLGPGKFHIVVLVHHNQLLLNQWRQKCSPLSIIEPMTSKCSPLPIIEPMTSKCSPLPIIEPMTSKCSPLPII